MSDPFDRFKGRVTAAQMPVEAQILRQMPSQAIGFSPNPAPQLNRLDLKSAMASSEGSQYMQYAEIMRICDLPLMFDMDDAEVEAYSGMNLLNEAYRDGFRFFPVQASAGMTYDRFRGLMGPIGVGFGKTLISLLIANKAFVTGVEKSILFVPSNVLIQLTQADIKWARSRIPFSVPMHIVAGKSRQHRQALAKSGKKGCYVLTYSLLSTQDAEELLYSIQPGLILADECQNLRHRDAARTQRFLRFCADHNPEQVYLSGTITNKSIMDYHHLIRGALDENCPLPISPSLANEWAAVIDATADAEAETAQAGALKPLVLWAQRNFPKEPIRENVSGFRRSFRLRLNHAPGVVSSGDAAIGTTLTIANRPVERPEDFAGWKELADFIDKIEELWETPNGDPIEWAIHKWKWLYELCAGFYNQLTWPAVETYARRKNMTEQEADIILARAAIQHNAAKEFSAALRKWLENEGRRGLDTPLLVEANIARSGATDVGEELYRLWKTKKDLDFPGRPDRDSTAVRVCEYKIRAAVQWAEEIEDRGGIIWVYHQEIGRWVYEALTAAGINALHCPAGDTSNRAILDPANGQKKIVASLEAHGTGKNLQHFQEQFYLQWPRPAQDAEQSLGRTHRSGQMADELIVRTCHTLLHDDLNFAACLNDSLYIHQSTGNRQKLIYAQYDPLPRIFPSAVLFERGLQVNRLSTEQERMMLEKFGKEV